MDLEQFHFLRPMWLGLLPVLIAVTWLMIKKRLGNRSWEAVCDSHLLPHMLIGGTRGSRSLPIILTALCGTLAILSLAGPAWERLPQPVFNRQSALVIALDLSRSMDANDVSPSRLGRAKFKIADILRQHAEGQLALLVYAADAFTVTPLTDDVATINSQLPALTTSIMPAQGSRPDLALRKAQELLKGAGHTSGNILLISDEIDSALAAPVAEELEARGYRIFVLGIGSRHGAPILNDDGSFLKDARGEIVIPVLEEQGMRETAGAGGGIYRKMTTDDGDINLLMKAMSSTLSGEQEVSTEFETDTWREQGPWLLLLLLPLAALAFRRGYMLAVCFLLLPVPDRVEAFEWDSLWLRDDQRALREMENGNTGAAAALFQDPAWKAAAQYRNGEFDSTLESLDALEDQLSLYNKGNALARMGQYEKAIEKYEEVLHLAPDHEDARFNKELLEKELEKQQQQQQQSGQNQDDQQEQEQEQEQQEQQEQQGGDSQGEDQQQQDEQKSEQAGNGNKDMENNEEQEQAQGQPEPEEEQQAEQESQQQPEPGAEEEKEAAEEEAQLAQAQQNEQNEEERATEQWLRRIPDDPAGLLRRKFLYQYKQRQGQHDPGKKQW